MYGNLLKYPGCKWNKHLALEEKTSLQSYLPKTDLFNKNNFIKFINNYPIIFLKPALGGGGRGVIKITKIGSSYLLHSSIYKKLYRSKRRLFYDLERRCFKRKYILQQGLDLLQMNQRPIDFRVLLLKPHHTWEFIGIMGKCAAKNKFVTNHARGGKSIKLDQVLKATLNYTDKQCDKMESKLETLSYDIAHSLNDYYENITELGLDIAIDQQEKIWLLEANTKPHFNLFKSHDNKNLYNKIVKYTRQLRS